MLANGIDQSRSVVITLSWWNHWYLWKTFFPTLANALLPKSNQWSYWKHYVKMEKRGALEKMRKSASAVVEVFRYAIVTGRADYNPAPIFASVLATPKKSTFSLSLLLMNFPTSTQRSWQGYTGSIITKTATPDHYVNWCTNTRTAFW